MAEKSMTKSQLKQAMLDDLEARGLLNDVYRDLVEQYMDLWATRKKLRADIKKRGVVVEDPKRQMMVENRSVSMEAQVSAQMLRLYKALGFQDLATGRGNGGTWDPDDEL